MACSDERKRPCKRRRSNIVGLEQLATKEELIHVSHMSSQAHYNMKWPYHTGLMSGALESYTREIGTYHDRV